MVAIRRWYPEQVVYDQEFRRYRYGGDAIVITAEVEYRVPDCWYIKGRLFGMVHGEMTMMDWWTLDDLDSTPTGSPTYTMQSGVNLGWQKDDWKFFGSLDYLAKVKEYTLDYDLQLVMGASCSLW